MVNRPIKKFRSGNIEGAIWLNEKESDGIKTEFKTASITRNWKRKEEDTWRNDVLNLRRMDIPKVMVILQKLQEELYLSTDAKDEGE